MGNERQPVATNGGQPMKNKNIYSWFGRLTYIDITGVWLRHPGNPYKCRGNGEHKTILGKPIECCCEECDYGLECHEIMLKDGVYDDE